MAVMPVYGRTYITFPPYTASTAGILAATADADTLITVPDGDPAVRGFQYETDGFGQVAELSWTDCLSTAQRAAVDGFDVVQSSNPFVVMNGYECSLAVTNFADAAQIATRRLIGGETVGVERHLWNNEFTAATDITPTKGTAVKPNMALGLLLEYAGNVYAGVPWIHAGRRATTYFGGANLISTMDDAALKGGGILVNGGGYTGSAHPVGSSAPSATQAWAYVTGRVVLVRDEVDTFQGVGTETNDAVVVAQRTYVPAIEAVRAAVLVDLS